METLAVVKLPGCRPRDIAETVRLSSIASNTGARSPGEALITCSTSAVAVCCSSASRCSVSSRAFSIAITACAAKFSSSAISFSENGGPSRRYELMQPSAVPSFRNGTQQARSQVHALKVVEARRHLRANWHRPEIRRLYRRPAAHQRLMAANGRVGTAKQRLIFFGKAARRRRMDDRH